MSISGEWVDPDDAPELSRAWFDKAELKIAGRQIADDAPTSEVTLTLDTDIVERFRATGPGWQARINRALRRAAFGG